MNPYRLAWKNVVSQTANSLAHLGLVPSADHACFHCHLWVIGLEWTWITIEGRQHVCCLDETCVGIALEKMYNG